MTSHSRRRFLQQGATGASLALVGHRWGAGLSAAEIIAAARSPFLEGNFAPVHEELTIDKLEVVGQLPDDLRGMYLRNGPNPQFEPLGRYHWFDGDGMLHGVHLEDGKASYRNRYVRTAGWQAERVAGKSLWKGLAEKPDLAKILEGNQPFKNAANTALVWHDDQLLALWEAGEPHAIHLCDLTTIGPHDFGGKLKHAFTAHPKIDPHTGEMMFFGYSALSPSIDYSVVDRSGQIVHHTRVRMRRPVMMHDFAITANYSVFLDLPAVFNLAARGPAKPMLSFDAKLGARIGLLPRLASGDAVRWFDIDPCFVFHTLNAYEEGDEVVLLACRLREYPDLFGLASDNTSPGSDPLAAATATMYRWRLNLSSGQVREESLDDQPSDLPRLAEQLMGRKNRFGYALALDDGGLLKYDLESGGSQRHAHGKNRKGGEGVFVPRASGTNEDDGWVLTYVHDADTGQAEMVVINAANFGSEPIARVLIPARIPFGFHGTWISDKLLERHRSQAET